MDYGAARFYWDVVITLLVGGNFLYTWVANRSDRNNQDIQGIKRHVDGLDKEVIQLKADIAHLPNHQDMGEIHEKINDVAGDLSHMRGKIEGIDHSLKMLNEYLLNKEKA